MNGLPNGRGTLRYRSGVEIVSNFSDGEARGPSIVSIPNYGRIEGELGPDGIANGVVRRSNGDEYSGTLREGQFHGRGLLTTAAGLRYGGEFVNGRPHGRGVSYNPATKELVEGNFADGSVNGDAYTDRNGVANLSTFRSGKDVTSTNLANDAMGAERRKIDEQLKATDSDVAELQRMIDALNRKDARMQKSSANQESVDAFNAQCKFPLFREARIVADTVVFFNFGWLGVSSVNEPQPTEEERRLIKEKKEEVENECAA
ncbi:MAG: hypothetical protein IT353_14120, partial [Gemmatimonadaceae bacterium]|nr:hypothetical protein [Gemmatimonadaceae bacterium]